MLTISTLKTAFYREASQIRPLGIRMRAMKGLDILTASVGLWLCATTVFSAITNESGSFVSEIERLRDLSFDKDSGLYVPPDQGHLNSFKLLADKLISGDLTAASTHAETSGYEVVVFDDTDSGLILHGLRETLNLGGETTNGWGSYFINPSNEVNELIQVPHPRFDTYSWEIGARLFVDMRAKGLMMAGAHRNANGQGTADVAHLTNSIFQMVHESWNGAQAENTAWSIHGFNISNHPAFPAGTDAVLSNGDGGIGFEITIIDADIETNGFTSYAFNTLGISNALNVQVNGSISGTNFSIEGIIGQYF